MRQRIRSRRPMKAPTGAFPPNKSAGLSARSCVTFHIPEDGNEIFSRIAGETARGTLMFRLSKPETPRAALFVFLRNETRAKSGFVSYVSISLCFDFVDHRRSRRSVLAVLQFLEFSSASRCHAALVSTQHLS